MTPPAPELRLERLLPAPPERVFEAWVTPALLTRWWAAAPGWRGVGAEVDLRPGGRYRLAMKDPQDGRVHAVTGEYLVVDRPRRLVFTWAWEGDPPEMEGSAETVVTVELHAEGDGTRLVLVHRGFAHDGVRDLHVSGWTGCLQSFAARALDGNPYGKER
ncbi:MAG: SRPBCC domain-containing protein [Actinomycetota bacterium]